MKMSYKEYICPECGHKQRIDTNHELSTVSGCNSCGNSRMLCNTPNGIKLRNEAELKLKEHRSTLPKSVYVRFQSKRYEKEIVVDGKKGLINCKIEWDDECKNGHNTFSITGAVYSSRTSKADRHCEGSGCIHDEIIKYFPEFKHLIEWHLFSSDGYHYLNNITYHAKNNDIKWARSCANWRDASIEQLKDEQLLKDRLPSLMEVLKKDIENLGMIY